MNDNFFKDLEDKSIIENNNNNSNNTNDNKENKKEDKKTKKRRPIKSEEDKVKVISISLQNKVLDKVKEEVEEKHSKSISISQFINKVLIDYFKEKGIM